MILTILFQMAKQIPEKFYFGVHDAYKSPNVFKINIGDISKTMIIEIMKVTFLLWPEVRGDGRSTITSAIQDVDNIVYDV